MMDANAVSVGFWEHYRQLFNRRGEDFWSIVFGYPVARLLVLLVLPIGWITPTLLTLIGFAVKGGAVTCLVIDDVGATWAAAGLLQLAQIFDSMDGTLARARPAFSHTGGFLDKITDAVSLYAIATAVGVRAAAETGDWHLIVLGSAAGACFLLLCYMFWIVRATGETVTPRSMAGAAPVPSWAAIGREWLRGWGRALAFGEADLYLWIALFAVFDRWRECVYLLLITQGVVVLKRAVDHLLTMRRSDVRN